MTKLVRDAVLAPDMLKVFAAEVAAESARESAEPSDTAELRRQKEKAEKEVANLIDAIATYGLRDNPDVQRRLRLATEARDNAIAGLALVDGGGTSSNPVTATAADLRSILDAFVQGDVEDPAMVFKARNLLAEMVHPFEAFPHPDGMEFRAKLRFAGDHKALSPRVFVVPSTVRKFVGKVVAGARFDSCLLETPDPRNLKLLRSSAKSG